MCEPSLKKECIGYKRQVRTKKNVSECPTPPPALAKCSVCHNAERVGCNFWSKVPFVSYTTLCGPTLGDILVHILNLLPFRLITWLAIGHSKTCCFVALAEDCAKSNSSRPNIKKPKKLCPEEVGSQDRGDRGLSVKSSDDKLTKWMNEEYVALARELYDLQRLTCERDGDRDSRHLLQARHYVLDRLAEMLSKREEIERRMKKKKQNRIC